MRFIGIDPGLSGAVALLPSDTDGSSIFDTPTGSDGRKTVYAVAEMAKIVEGIHPNTAWGCCHFVIEKQHAMPKQGVSSTFSIGYGYGLWEGILAALGIPYTVVTPQAWKGAMMAGQGREKDASRLRAQQLWPELAGHLNLKKHHGRAEALLIAEYGRRISNDSAK